jgi:hypothetical protein
MTNDITPTRRRFLKGGALLAAPVAIASVPAVALADDRLKARVMRLEDEAAVRELHHSWLRQVNAGDREALLDSAVCRIISDHAGAPDKIEIATDGRSAVGYFDCAVDVETPLAKDCTLAQMAHAQGTGTMHRTVRRMLTIDYTKSSGTWEIERVALPTITFASNQ